MTEFHPGSDIRKSTNTVFSIPPKRMPDVCTPPKKSGPKPIQAKDAGADVETPQARALRRAMQITSFTSQSVATFPSASKATKEADDTITNRNGCHNRRDYVTSYPVQDGWYMDGYGTVLDASYEAMDRLARSAAAVDHGIGSRLAGGGMPQPPLMGAPPDARWTVPDPNIGTGRDVLLLHPWSLGAVSKLEGADVLLIGVGFAELHAQMPWSARRWKFVTEGLLCRTPALWWGNVQSIARALRGARSVGWQSDAHANTVLESLQTQLWSEHSHPVVTSLSEPSLFSPVEPYCESFAKWWRLSKIAF